MEGRDGKGGMDRMEGWREEGRAEHQKLRVSEDERREF